MSCWRILSVASLCLLQDRLPYEGSQSSVTIIPQLDVTCILKTWKIKGVLACPSATGVRTCLWVENAYPCGILEVVRQPFKSHLLEFPSIPFRKTTSGHNENQLQFAETRVFTFVPPLVQNLEIPIAAPDGAAFQYSYVSELDLIGWRTGLLDLLFPRPRKCAGKWGCYVPRTGWVDQPSEPIAAHLQALRAGRVAANPWGRVVLSMHSYEPRTGHFIQMIAPALRGCVSIGHPDLRALEAKALSPHGAYLFVQWGLFEECEKCLPPRLLGPRAPP